MKALPTVAKSKPSYLIQLFVTLALVASCSSEEETFCTSAQEFQESIEQIDLSDFTSALSPEFWADLQATVTDLDNQTSGELNNSVNNIKTELDSLVEQLKDADYDLAKILLSPATLSELTAVSTSLVDFVALQLQGEIDSSCAK